MGDGPSNEELISICNKFLHHSPPGEFNEVVADVKALLHDDSILNASAAHTFRNYNTEQMLQVKSPGHDHEFLITTHGEVGDGEYIDHKGRQVVSFDHIRQTTGSTRGISGGDTDSSVESARASIEAAGDAYQQEHYPFGALCVYGKSGKVIATISASRFNSGNFVNGRWRSVWTITPGKQIELNGIIKVCVHYYEDGNVQLNTDFTKTLSAPSGANIGEAVFKAIAKAEADFQTALEHSYNSMSENTFKALRRVLPVTKYKVDWDKIKSYKIGGELGAQAASGRN